MTASASIEVLPSKQELLSDLEDAYAAGNIERVKLIAMQLAMRSILESLPRLRRIYRDNSRAILDASVSGGDIVASLGSLIADLGDEFERILLERAEEFLIRARADAFRLLSRGGLLAAGVAVDRQRLLKPPPGDLPRVQTSSRSTVLSSASPLLVVTGDKAQSERADAEELLASIDNARITSLVQSTDPAVAMRWAERIRLIPRTLILAIESGDVQDALEAHRMGLESFLRHESLRVRGLAEDFIVIELGRIAAGYVLRSRFWPTTDPTHAANDGLKWFKDNRPSADGLWSERLIPPYRKNCVCYTVPILESPGAEFEVNWPVAPDLRGVELRGVGRWRNWFNQRQADVQRLIVGDKLWMAAASAGTGRVRYEDFLGVDGRLLTIARLVVESAVDRANRTAVVAKMIERVTVAEEAAWQKLEPTTPAMEAEYREKLLRQVD